MSDVSTVVLRIPSPDGDFVFRVARVSEEQADQLEQNIAVRAVEPGMFEQFGPPLNLAEAMRNIETRDFCVLDMQ